jgi:hypothetical protein
MPTKFVVDAFIDKQMKLCAYVSLNARRRCIELRLGPCIVMVSVVHAAVDGISHHAAVDGISHLLNKPVFATLYAPSVCSAFGQPFPSSGTSCTTGENTGLLLFYY